MGGSEGSAATRSRMLGSPPLLLPPPLPAWQLPLPAVAAAASARSARADRRL